jgi:hypothetical protein
VAEGGRERWSGLTPGEQSSTCELGGQESVPNVPVAGDPREDTAEESEMTSSAGYMDRELSDDELADIWESTTVAVRHGRIPTFDDKTALIEDVLRRLRRRRDRPVVWRVLITDASRVRRAGRYLIRLTVMVGGRQYGNTRKSTMSPVAGTRQV